MNARAIPHFGQPRAPHLYRIGVEPTVQSVVTGVIDGTPSVAENVTVTHIEVHARTRWSAMAIAKEAGYVVRDCNMIG